MAGAVEGVGTTPALDGLFAVVEDQPDGVAFGRVGAEDVANLDEQGRGGCSVVGSVKIYVAKRVVCLVVRGEDDYAVAFAGEAHNEVVHGLEASGGICGEGIGLEVAVGDFGREGLLDELLGLEVPRGAVEPLGGDLKELFGERVGGLAVETGGLGVKVCGCQQENKQ